jgi:hypothetical protein
VDGFCSVSALRKRDELNLVFLDYVTVNCYLKLAEAPGALEGLTFFVRGRSGNPSTGISFGGSSRTSKGR